MVFENKMKATFKPMLESISQALEQSNLEIKTLKGVEPGFSKRPHLGPKQVPSEKESKVEKQLADILSKLSGQE